MPQEWQQPLATSGILSMPSFGAHLPPDFLSKPPTGKVTKEKIDFAKSTLPQHDGAYAVVLDGIMEPWECREMIQAAIAANEAAVGHGWERAMLNVGQFQQVLEAETRNSSRCIIDDAEIAARLWARVAPFVPEIDQEPLQSNVKVTGSLPVLRGDIYEFAGLNERLRFLMYGPGEYFREHIDAAFTRPDKSETSFYTLQLYLNEQDDENPLAGGATSLHDWGMNPSKDININPKFGRVFIFQHRDLLHSGQEVRDGVKLNMRTDLMFRKSAKKVPQAERPSISDINKRSRK